MATRKINIGDKAYANLSLRQWEASKTAHADTSMYYQVDDTVYVENVIVADAAYQRKAYRCLVDHNSSADFHTDFIANRWVELWPDEASVLAPVDIVLATAESVTAFVAAGDVKDGVTLTTDDRILLTEQADKAENGIWLYKGDGNALARPADYINTQNHIIGVEVAVKDGSFKGAKMVLRESNHADLETVVVDTSQTIWSSIFDSDDIQLEPVDIALEDNQNVAAFQATGNSKDGVTLVADTSRILLAGQTTQSQNGVWLYKGHNIALERPVDYSNSINEKIGRQVMVKNGSKKGSQYILSESGNTDLKTVVVDTDATVWIYSSGAEQENGPVEIALESNQSVASFQAAGNSKDGITLTVGDRILLFGQNTKSQNGIWVYNGHSSALVRPGDYKASKNHIVNEDVIVKQGSFEGSRFVLSLSGNADKETVIVDTDATTWREIDSVQITQHAPAKIVLLSDESVTAFLSPDDTGDADATDDNKDGVKLAVDDRILLVGQTDKKQNGIWLYKGHNAALVRPADYDSLNNSIINEDIIIKDGTYKGSRFILAETNNADLETVVIDTNETLWVEIESSQTLPTNYHEPVHIALESNESVTAFQAAANAKDGITLVPNTSRILLANQTTASQNGIWLYKGHNVALERPSDYSSAEDRVINEDVIVRDGNRKGVRYILSESNNTDLETVVVDTDNTVWVKIEAQDKVLLYHKPVEVAFQTAESITSFSAPANLRQSITLVPNTSRILLTGQADKVQNGIWLYKGNATALERPSDYSSTENREINEDVIVKQGTYEGERFILRSTNNDLESVVVDTDESVWSSTGSSDVEYHIPVRIALETNESVATFSAVGNAKDGVTLATDDRILLFDQTDKTQNGIWIYKGNGSALVRPIDYNSENEINEDVIVEDGTYKGIRFILSESNNTDGMSVVVGTDETIWTQFKIKDRLVVSVGAADNAMTINAANAHDYYGKVIHVESHGTPASETQYELTFSNDLPRDFKCHVVSIRAKGVKVKGNGTNIVRAPGATGATKFVEVIQSGQVMVEVPDSVGGPGNLLISNLSNKAALIAKTDENDDYVTANGDGDAQIEGIELWMGTQAEYDGIATKKAATLYFVDND